MLKLTESTIDFTFFYETPCQQSLHNYGPKNLPNIMHLKYLHYEYNTTIL